MAPLLPGPKRKNNTIMQSSKSTNPKAQRKRTGRKARRNQNKPNNVNAAPTAISLVTKTRSPAIKTTARGVVVTHREYVQDLTSADSNFRNTSFSVNPGLATTFPWLSAVAGRFESYLFRRLHFIYEPVCPTTTPGAVMMAIDYDAADTTPTTKVVLMSYKGAVRSAPWNITKFDASRDDLRKFGIQRYVRTTTNPSGTDVKTYDVGRLQVATQNTPAVPTTLGELYVEYEVEFFTPQLAPVPTTARRNVVQTARVTMPATGNIILDALVAGDTATPSFWLTNPTTAGATLILDANRMGDFYLTTRAANLGNVPGGVGKLHQFYDNMAYQSESPYKVFRVGNSPESLNGWGFLSNTSATAFDYTLLFSGYQDKVRETVGANLIPLFVPRPTSGSYTFTVTTRPANVHPGTTFTHGYQKTGTDWAFPEIDIPSFETSSSRTLLSKPGLVQSFTLATNDVGTPTKD